MKREVFPDLRSVGWGIGESPEGHVVVVDVDAQPELAAKYDAKSLPLMVRLKSGVPVGRSTGYKSAQDFSKWWNSYTKPQAKPQAKASQTLGTARWTFPGSTRAELIAHLSGPNHGHSVEWLKTLENSELQKLHDADHDSVQVRQNWQPTKQQKRFLFFTWE